MSIPSVFSAWTQYSQRPFKILHDMKTTLNSEKFFLKIPWKLFHEKITIEKVSTRRFCTEILFQTIEKIMFNSKFFPEKYNNSFSLSFWIAHKIMTHTEIWIKNVFYGCKACFSWHCVNRNRIKIRIKCHKTVAGKTEYGKNTMMDLLLFLPKYEERITYIYIFFCKFLWQLYWS